MNFILKLASRDPSFRRALIKKLAEEEKPEKGKASPDFLKFWKEVYEDGKKRVSNPNPKTKDKQRDVAASTAMKDPKFKKQIKKEFQKWKSQNKDKGRKNPYKSIVDEVLVKSYKKKISSLIKGLPSKKIKPVTKGKKRKKINQLRRDLPKDQKQLLGILSSKKNMDKLLDLYMKEVDDKRFFETWSEFKETDGPTSLEACGTLSKMGVKGSLLPGEEKEASRGPDQPEEWMKQVASFTKAFFEAMGIEELVLYRGIAEELDEDPGAKVKVNTRALSSWSADPKIAAGFGKTMVKSKVPTNQIFGLPFMMDPRYFKEKEFPTMGSEALPSEIV
jgi:hypothetical protein